MKEFKKDQLNVKLYESRSAMGLGAAADIAACMKALVAQKGEISVIFAAAPSQNETLEALKNDKTIPWEHINAYHMDEYVGIASDAPQGFANFLKNALFDHVPFQSVNLLDSTNEAKAEAARYSALLNQTHIDIVCMGIGENGHIAFNDPHVADFHDPETVKIVDLDPVCRMQQVHDGCFASLEQVPLYALTLTVPTLAKADYHFCMVPAAAKADAVTETLTGTVDAHCPATILRTCPHAVLYVDSESGRDFV